MTYSYCAENIIQNGMDKMRFELGDTMVLQSGKYEFKPF